MGRVALTSQRPPPSTSNPLVPTGSKPPSTRPSPTFADGPTPTGEVESAHPKDLGPQRDGVRVRIGFRPHRDTDLKEVSYAKSRIRPRVWGALRTETDTPKLVYGVRETWSDGSRPSTSLVVSEGPPTLLVSPPPLPPRFDGSVPAFVWDTGGSDYFRGTTRPSKGEPSSTGRDLHRTRDTHDRPRLRSRR